MQVIFIINIVLMFCISGFLLHNFYRVSNDKMIAFHTVNDIEFVKDDSKNLEKKVQLIPIDDESVSIVDLQELSHRLSKKEFELKEKEILLREFEKSNREQVLYLEKMQKEILELVSVDSQDNSQKMHSLAKIYKNIPVEVAAKIFELLDMNSLMLVVSYIDEVTLSNILSYLDASLVQKIKEISISLSKECTCNNDLS